MKKTLLALLFATTMIATSCGGNTKPAETPSKTEDTDKKENTENKSDENEKKEEATNESTSEKSSLDELYDSVDKEVAKNYQATMITDVGGVNDAGFNQSSWEGLQELNSRLGVKVSYLESHQESDFRPNFEKQIDSGSHFVWSMGFGMADATKQIAQDYPEVNFAIIDIVYDEETLKNNPNLTGVMIYAQDASFEVGYAAALATKSGKVGFVGGMKGTVIDQFEYGYRAGVAYANKETGKNVEVDVQYVESFADQAKGKAIATKMMQNGCDIVYHGAGQAGLGVIEAAKEQGKMYIGCDRDQSDVAPDNVFTSALKKCNIALQETTLRKLKGEEIGGKNLYYGIKEGASGIPTENKNMDKEIYEKTMLVEQKIKSGEIVPAYNKETYDEFVKNLK